jgi:methylisocitrate lyase
MTDIQGRTESCRQQHVAGTPFVLVNVLDAGRTKVVARSGAKAIGTSSWAVADAHGFQDGESIPISLAVDNLRRIVNATTLPVTLDLESGYGEQPEGVGEAVRLAMSAGAVGCNLEDSYPSTRTLRTIADQGLRIRAAREAARESNPGFFINARTDVFFQGRPDTKNRAMLRDVLDRARAYADAGADGLFVPGLTDLELIAELTQASPLPINVYNGDGTLDFEALASRGVARISFGGFPYGKVMQALTAAAQVAMPHMRAGSAES